MKKRIGIENIFWIQFLMQYEEEEVKDLSKLTNEEEVKDLSKLTYEEEVEDPSK